MPVGRHPRVPADDSTGDRGSVVAALVVAMALLALAMIFTASLITTVQRSKASTDAMMLTQYTDTAVAAAIEKLNTGKPVANTLDTSTVTCERVANRNMCFRYWALPVPGTALDPIRYDLVTRVWIDTGSRTEPADGTGVRSEKTPLEVITYQTTGGLGPTLTGGYIAYNPTPAGLFANAIHGFNTVDLEGPNLSVRSYNSQTGATGTLNATVSSSGWLAYGASTQADRTVLFGGASTAGDHTTRCTGEACTESGVRVIASTYATPTDASLAWMRTVSATTCNTVITGDWVSSEHSGQLPAGITCINGALIVDSPTTTLSPLTTVYVNGVIQISDSLNAPLTGQLASPSSLVIYSTGAAITFAPAANAGIAAMMYAPLATCGTDPANTNHITYFGSLVCGTVSLGGEWEHLYDEAAVAQFIDPVPGAAKTFAPGVPTTVGFGDFHVPDGWVSSGCVVAPPTGASGYWKLDETAGVLARDSSGSGLAAGWASTSTGRADGVCGKAAFAAAGGAIRGTFPVTANNGLTIEYWGKALIGTTVTVAGVQVTQDSTSHVTVTVGSTVNKVPFTVQNPTAWHLYTVTVSSSGTVTLYVDGIVKRTVAATVAPGTVNGPVTIGDGASTGIIDEVVYYNTPLTATKIATRWTWWNTTVTVTTADPGTPFSPPTAVSDNGSSPTAMKVKWTAPTGTFPTSSSLTGYRIEMSPTSGGTYTALGTVTGATTLFTQANPAVGTNYYRVCATYNGDTMCSAGTPILTLAVPAAPVVTVGTVTTTTAVFNWTTPTYTASFESQYRTNGGVWSATINESTNVARTHGPTTQGTKIGVQVRAINAAGTGPWSAVASATLGIDIPHANGWQTQSSYPYLYARLVYSAGAMCPAGTVVQDEMRDQVTSWGTSWNGYGAWSTGTAGASYGPWMASGISSYDVGANQLHTIRCNNPASGAVSASWGEHGPISLWHPIPNPTGVWAGLASWRTAGWGASCVAGTTASYQWQVVAATFNTGVQGWTWTFSTSWANTGQAWGSGTTWVTARCEAAGPRYSGTVSANGSF